MSRASPVISPRRIASSLYLLAAYAATLPSVLIGGLAASSSDLIAALKLACLAAFAWHAARVLRDRPAGGGSALALAAATGLLWSALAVMSLYEVVAMAPLDFSMVIVSIHDARRTLVHVLGPHGALIAVGALAALAMSGTGAAWALLRGLRARLLCLPHGPRGAVACVGLLCYFAAADLWYAAEELVLYPRVYSVESPNTPALLSVPDYSAIPIRSRETVFVLQLESVNSLAVFEPAAGPHFRARVPQPGLETIVKEGGGVLFPLFWANGTQTHRAWESILCGMSGNLGPAISAEPSRLQRLTCLPGHLAGAGYSAVFLYSYFNLDFFNLGEFAHKAGFSEVVYGPKLMREGDRSHQWGYDDCVFYERAFDYLVRQGLDKRERVFAYFEVGMHHAPFFNSSKHPAAHPYDAPASFLEHYLNSNAEQDHCLLVFWKRFRQLGRDDVHLFIVPDHSLWVHGVPAYPDAGFATWLAYVPPARRAAEFKPRTVASPTPSQAQLYPTILELLEGASLPGSFAFSLRGEPPPPSYADCHLLTAPSQRLVVRKNGQRAEYRLRASSVVVPGSVFEPDFWGFRENFACN